MTGPVPHAVVPLATDMRPAGPIGRPKSFALFAGRLVERKGCAWFIRNVPREAGTLPHVLDMEWNHLSPTCKLRPDPAIVRREMKVFPNLSEDVDRRSKGSASLVELVSAAVDVAHGHARNGDLDAQVEL